MKKAITIVLGVFLLYTAHAQISIGPAIGVNLTEFHSKTTPINGDKKVINPRVGALCNIPIAHNFHFQPGIIFSRNGFYREDKRASYTEQFYLHVAELPLYLTYKTRQQGGFFVSVGASANLNINGEVKNYSPYSGSLKGPIKFGDPNVRRFSFAAVGNLGYEFKNGLSIRAFGQTLLTSLAHVSGSRLIYNNFGLSVAYMFPFMAKKQQV